MDMGSMTQNIVIDKEFQALIPPLSAEERTPNLYARGLAVLAARKVVTQAKAEQRFSSNAWIAAARAAFKPGPKQPCVVCGKFQSVAHAHHLTPLCRQVNCDTPDDSFVWLCPTHHQGVHLCLEGSKRGAWPDLSGFSDEEQLAMADIANMGEKS